MPDALQTGQTLWDVAYEVVLREVVRAGRDLYPMYVAAVLVDAMRGGGWLPSVTELACMSWWYAHQTEPQRAKLRAAVTTGLLPDSARHAVAACGDHQSVDCCPAQVLGDPVYGESIAELANRAASRRAAGGYELQLTPKSPPARPSRGAVVASWLIAIGAFGSFALALHRLYRERHEAKP